MPLQTGGGDRGICRVGFCLAIWHQDIIGAGMQLVYLGDQRRGGNVPSDPARRACVSIPIAGMKAGIPKPRRATIRRRRRVSRFPASTLNAARVYMADKHGETNSVVGTRAAPLPGIVGAGAALPVFVANHFGQMVESF
ncbi:hypothetical protein KCP73_12810 [Salmonella enterica subsp. enterica]|nr:hypothetical protein KCP73_12810 [Salmonella enterica subsp. enterica]